MEELLAIDPKSQNIFNFQQPLNIEAINMETRLLNTKAHLFWEIPVIDAKVNGLMDSLLYSGDAKKKLIMTGDTKDATTFFSVKKWEQEQDITQELIFVDSLFMMCKLKQEKQKKEYYLEVLLLQYNTLLFNCKKSFM